MKKLIFILILLVLAGGTGLYFGWVNIKPGNFGVAHSTITGTIPYPLESGRIHWFWQKLIPKSFQLYLVDKEPRSVAFDTSHALPGSEQLQEFGNFDLVVHTAIQFSIDFNAARVLIDLGILEAFEEHLGDELSTVTGETVSGFLLENMMRQSETDAEVSYSALDELRQKLEQRLRDTLGRYELAETRWNVTFSEIPQIDLYNDALNRYFAHLENVYRFKREELDRESEYLARARENDLEIDRFKKYGELIEQYPELLKYFYIQRFSEQADVLVLPQNESTGFPKMLEPWEQLDKKPAPEQRPASPPVEPKEEEFPQPEEQLDEAERTIEGTDTEEDETGKWYDPLMFWKREKGDG